MCQTARSRPRFLLAALVALATVGYGAAVCAADAQPRTGVAGPRAGVARPRAGVAAVARPRAGIAGASALTVGTSTVGPAIPAGFVGLSIEIPAIVSYAGLDPQAVNPVLEQLIRNLAPGQSPVLRIGGDSTDWTWYPVPHMARPPWVRYTLTQRWLQVTRALVQAVDGRVIFGVNLEADSTRVADAEANALIGGIGSQSIDALEIGNEPELYGSFSWYRTPTGRHVTGRPRGYDFTDFTHDVSNIARGLPQIALAGPAIGSPTWIKPLRRFLAAEPRVGVVTLHRYPLKHCVPSAHLTDAELLSETSSIGLADSVARYAAIAHADGHALRIDEMNSIACGGQRGVSNTFASSLWSLDALFAMASVGVDGVNIHTVPNSINELFSFKRVNGEWQGNVHPDYYGLLMFAQAAPAGSRLLNLSGTTRGAFRAWATLAPDGHIRVVLINTSTSQAQLVTVRAPSAAGSGTLERLTAPAITATSGVSFGGQSFGSQTSTGTLAGVAQPTSIVPVAGAYAVRVPAASAALLTLSVGP
jgi:Glycosyl hydrolase family 79 C-terminal beta domain